MSYHNKKAMNLIRLAGRRLFSTSQSNGNERFSPDSLHSTESVLSEKYRAVTIISLNRPNKKNALSKSMLSALADTIRNFDSDPKSSVGILCGIGGNFSVGYDLDELWTSLDNNENILQNISFEQNLTEKPIICCISGYCLSLALELALMCDIRIVEEGAVMQFSNRQFGIPLVNGGVQRLAQLVGVSRATDITLTGREIKAKEAQEIGLASCVVTDGSCLGRALSTALHMSSFPQSTLKFDKRKLCMPLASDSGKVDELPANILNDIKAGMKFEQSEKILTYLGSKRSTRHFKLQNMPAWEQAEYARELEYMNKMGNEEKKE